MNTYLTGLVGEARAARHVKRLGMRVLERRYRAGHCEIDLIARDKDGETVFIEVKYRPRGRIGQGQEAVTQKKRQHLIQAAQSYLMTHPAQNYRFDVIEISAAGLRYIKHAL